MGIRYNILIKKFSDASVVQRIPVTGGIRTAHKVEKGANINLNHDEYYTEREEIEDPNVIDRVINAGGNPIG